MEIAGQTIIQLVNQAVEAADANVKHALDVAHKLSHELRAAEQRNNDLVADLRYYKDRAERAAVRLAEHSAHPEPSLALWLR